MWEANTYTVNYVSNKPAGASGEITGSTASSAHTYDVAAELSANGYALTGWTFSGWATEKDGAAVYGDKAEVLNLAVQDGQTVTLYAVWEKAVSFVVLDAQGGSGGGSFSAEYGELPKYSPTVPSRAGYSFNGYYTGENGAGTQVFDRNMTFTADGWNINERNVVLYAMWTPVTYYVVYVNGAIEAGAPQLALYGVPFSLRPAEESGIYAPENAHFVGWAVYPGSMTAIYTDGQYIEHGLTQTEGEQVRLYAVFAENARWSVSYDANGGDGVPVDGNTYYTGESVYFSSVIPERYGYIFLGWSDAPRDSAADYPYTDGSFATESFTMPEGGIKLYAVWQAGDTLQAQIGELENAQAQLQLAVDDLKSTADAAADTVAALAQRLQNAENLIAGLDDTYATDAALSESQAALTALIEEAKTELAGAIEDVRSELFAETDRLAEIIDGKADSSELALQLENVRQAYEAADALVTNGYIAADNALEQSLTQAMDTALGNLRTQLEEQLTEATAELQTALGTKADAETVAQSLAELEAAYAAADAVLKSEISEELTASLNTAIISAADGVRTELNGLIEEVKNELDANVQELNGAIALKADAAALEQKAEELADSYAAADELLSNRFIAADTAIRQELTGLIDGVNAELSTTIEGVETELNSAIEQLRNEMSESDNTNVQQLKAALDKLEEEYKAADVILDGKLTGLQAYDVVVGERLDALESAYKTADDALMAGLEKLQTALEEMRGSLNDKDAALEEKVDLLASDNRDAEFVYTVVNICLAGVAVLLFAVLIVRVVKNRKSVR